VWWTQSVQTALLRYLGLEIGRRLVARGQLGVVANVFFLEAHEARSALLDGGRQQDRARVRRGQRAWATANPPPAAYGDPPPDAPPFDLLPTEARLVNEAVLWGFGQFFGTPSEAGNAAVVVGTAASAGRYTGPVRVVMGEHEFGKIQPGDVVVCPATSPTWSVVVPSIGALVADSGGILSHPAIIAREHGIPAVVGTATGTTTLRDGQSVTVDGTAGVVEVMRSMAPSAVR
jgi:phosphohistidine swiveling domain-containing protein